MLLEWSNGQVTVECSKSLADKKAMEQYLIGPGVHNHVMLHTMHQLSLLETQVTAAMVRQWRARLKRFLLRVPDAARASFHCSHTCLFWMPPAQRAAVIDTAAAAIHEALEIRLNPGFFHETSVKYFKLRLARLNTTPCLGPSLGIQLSTQYPKIAATAWLLLATGSQQPLRCGCCYGGRWWRSTKRRQMKRQCGSASSNWSTLKD